MTVEQAGDGSFTILCTPRDPSVIPFRLTGLPIDSVYYPLESHEKVKRV